MAAVRGPAPHSGLALFRDRTTDAAGLAETVLADTRPRHWPGRHGAWLRTQRET